MPAMTIAFIIAVSLLVAAYDVACLLGWLDAPTISETVRAWGRAWPWAVRGAYAAAALFLYWHFFLQEVP